MDQRTGEIQREALDQLATALCAAQAEIRTAEESGTNPHLKRRYSTLTDIWAACREPLTKHGLCVVQLPLPDAEGWLSLETVLIHTSGQRLSSVLRLPLAKLDAQGFGAALSYARRYALAALVGVTSGHESEDDGGESQAERGPESQGDRQAGALPLNDTAETCRGCGAPSGRPHTRSCRMVAR